MSRFASLRQWHETASSTVETALGVSEAGNVAAKVITGPRLVIREQALCGLLTIRASASNESLDTACGTILKLDRPKPLRASERAEYCLRWMSPDEWLLSCPMDQVDEMEVRLRNALSGHVALVNVSCGYQRLDIDGADARTVLQKSTAYDVHPDNLDVGKVVSTTFAKSQVVLRCVDDERYELIVRRSFADYVWLWLNDAAREYRQSERL